MTLSDSPRVRLFTLCALYLAQGIPWGFVAITLVAWLAEQGLGAKEVAQVTMLSTLPWTFKWVWGPVIDRYGFPSMGRRRPWILLAQALMALTILAMVSIPNLATSVGVLAWMVFVHNVFNALQDVAVDALAVDLLSETERGKANGLMYGSKYLGGAIGGAGMATVIDLAGLKPALILQFGLLAAIFTLPLLLRERPGERLLPWTPGSAASTSAEQSVDSVWVLLKALGKAFSVRSSLLGAGFAVCMHIGTGILAVVGVVFIIQQLGWTDAEYSQVVGGPGLLCGLGGSIAGGFLADRFGARKMIAVGMLGMAACWLGFASLEAYWSFRPLVIGLILLESALSSIATVGMFALAMGISWPKVAATQFTAYMAMLNLSSAVGNGVAGYLEGSLDYKGALLLCAGIHLVVVAILPFIDPREISRKLGMAVADPVG